jgi:5'-nucleotidase
VARRATKITQERQQNEFVLVLDAGDSLTGDQDPARKTLGKSSVEVMNRLGYDALALGPKDLALGLTTLRQRIAEAQFAVLSANAVVAATGELVAQPYVVRAFAGHRVAVVGLSGTSSLEGSGSATGPITARDPLATAQKVMAELQGQADVIILLSHAGPQVDQQIADAVPGIAAIVGGGPGALAEPWRSAKTGTLLFHADQAQSGHAGRVVGVGRLTFDPQGKLTAYTWQAVQLGPDIVDDPAMAAWVQQQMSR